MRSVSSHLLEDKMDDAVTHYINSHQSTEAVHVDANSLALNVQDDGGGRVVTVMQPLSFSTSQMCRQVSVNDQVSEGQWSEELMDPESRLAAIVAHLSRPSNHQTHHKISAVRNDVDTSVILDAPMRLYNGPPLDSTMLTEQDRQVLDIAASASPVQNKHQSKKSLPHKKRISKKLKRNTGNSTPQQEQIVVIHCNPQVSQEEILPDNFVGGVPHPDHLAPEPHHIAHDMRPILLCQLCGEFYGEDQVKFYHHLRQHYEPHGTIIIENPVPDLSIDKMTNTCIVDNVQTLPDSLVELSLENTVPKSIYQPIDKHILYTTSDKTLSCHNKVQYTMAGEKELPQDNNKADLYDTFGKLDLYNCPKCDKSFKKQKQCEEHVKDAHLNPKPPRGNQPRPHAPVNIVITDQQQNRQPNQGGRYPIQGYNTDKPWSDLKYHKASIHSDQKNFKCEFCDKEFARRYSLNVHRRIHTGERNYKCDYCNKTFRASSYRLSHMRTHTGSKPYKCPQCEKCFRVAYDLRRHMLIHEKVRLRVDEMKPKSKDSKDKKSKPEEPKPKAQEVKPTKKSAPNRLPILKSMLDKKQPTKTTKKTQTKKGAPNVTVAPNKDVAMKMNDKYTNNVEVFDTRQVEYNKYKDVFEYRGNEVLQGYKKDYSEEMVYKESDRLTEERELAVLRPMFRNTPPIEELEKNNMRSENTDGNFQVFTHIEKNTDGNFHVYTHADKSKNYIIPTSASQSDMKLDREMIREVRNDGLSSDNMDNVFLERLSAFYNITAV
ncbi:Oocyte zinc finger protein XlCOF28 [Papilio machaon]|uniref:Oocyte zinc finger protein XlCOF28 n=1 Tax=Papilio machaon TaxID=76193 RepID=A0A194REH6_PAPMA|nr:Oocyte zinc finger protein XlCOF28 [Papilio machaon]